MKLRKKQSEFIDYAYNRLCDNRYALCELPTAFGKTICSLKLAQKMIFSGKANKVYIVSPTNQLSRETYAQAKALESELPSFALVIGKNNYLSVEKVLAYVSSAQDASEIIPFSVSETKEKINSLRSMYDYVLIDDFLDEFNISDAGKREFVYSNFALDRSIEKNVEDVEIVITNYPYLFTQIFFNKSFTLPENCAFIFDEVQELPKSAELILSSKFSINGFLLQLKRACEVVSAIDFIPKTFKSSLVKMIKLTEGLNFLYKDDKNKTGFLSGASAQSKATAIGARLFAGELFKKLDASFNKLCAKYGSKIPLELTVLFQKAYEGKKTLQASDIYISYSKEKGYASFNTYSRNAGTYLATRFWNKISRFSGISATVNVTGDPHDLSPYRLLGINFENLTIGGNEYPALKDKVCLVKRFEGELSASQATYKISTAPFDEDVDVRMSLQANEILANYDGKNSLVIVGGFDEVNVLAKKLREKGYTGKLITANPLTSIKNTVELFVKEGGILIGTRNYATGINLKGKLLERLFISKLPYPVYDAKKWLDLKSKNVGLFWYYYNNEMLMNFRQAIGRLIRDPKDKGKIYILDSRINELQRRIKDNLFYFLEKIAEEER